MDTFKPIALRHRWQIAILVGFLLCWLAGGASRPAIPPSVHVTAEESNKYVVVISYQNPTAAKVSVVGTFNHWDPAANPMSKKDGTWTATIRLNEGEYRYKFLVDGSHWTEDPENSESDPDGFGGLNSVLRLVAAEKRPAIGAVDTATSVGRTSAFCPSVAVTPLANGNYRVSFRFHPASDSQSVSLAGTFNEWDVLATPMTHRGEEFVATLDLPEGEYEYKYVVDGKTWLHDPLNPEEAADGHSGTNSVVRLGIVAQIEKSSAQIDDGQICDAALYHDPSTIDYFNPQADGSAVVKLRALAHDVTTATFAGTQCCPAGCPVPEAPMRSEYADERFEYFRVTTPAGEVSTSTVLNRPGGTAAPGCYSYTFEVRDGGAMPVRLGNGPPTSSSQAMVAFTVDVRSQDVFATPDWARTVVWYDIVMDRFRNGTKDNDSSFTRPWNLDWEMPGPGESPELYPAIWGRTFGGDIQGCMEKLPYLKRLGVGAIWFNPIFKSNSPIKYDTRDYRHVDDHFGELGDYDQATQREDLLDSQTWKFTPTDRLFLEFVRRAHEAGIRVIVDGVFNHSGTAHPAFQDVRRERQHSRFRDWYDIASWSPMKWEGWNGFDGLPVYKEDSNGFVSPTLREHIKSITRRWMDPNLDGDPSDGIDGWRLDVANEVSSEWWREWRTFVKSVNPDALIVGEIWVRPQRWLRGDQFDSVMNYEFARTMMRFFADDGPPSAFRQELARQLHSIPDQADYAMMNLVDSHDTDRAVSMLFNPGRRYDEHNRVHALNPGEYRYNGAKPGPEYYRRLKMLVAVQFAFVGSPMIYYGDEAGMWGADDPDNRRQMSWDDVAFDRPDQNRPMSDVFEHFQRCAAIRNALPALQTGEYEMLAVDDLACTIAFRRFSATQTVIVAANNSDSATQVSVPLPAGAPTSYVDVLNDSGVEVVVAGAHTKDRTRIEVRPAACRSITARGNILSVALRAREAAILLGQ